MFLCLGNLVFASAASSSLADEAVVEVVKVNWSDEPYVHPNLPWTVASKKEAAKAIKYGQVELQQELGLLKILGATQAKVSYIKTDAGAYPDWKEYVQQFNQYVLVGLNAKGKRIGVSKSLPADGPDLAARLIQLEKSPCSLTSKPVSGSSLPICRVKQVDSALFLRAAFRTFLNNSADVDFGQAYEFQNQLRVCLANRFPYKITSGILSCPRLKEIFAAPKDIPLAKDYKTFSFSVAVNKEKNTAVVTYKGKDMSKVAPNAIYTSHSLMKFSY